MQVNIDPQSLTLGDLEDWEAATGKDSAGLLAKFDKGGFSLQDLSVRELTVLVWISARKDDPGLTLDDVRASKLVDLELNRPLAGAGGGSKNGSRSSAAASRGARPKSSAR